MLLYAITSRVLLPGTEAERANKLVALAATWAANGVDFIQIREKDLSATDLTQLTANIVQAARKNGSQTKVLMNAGIEIATSIALEAGADGLHIPGGLNLENLTADVTHIRETWQIRQTETKSSQPTISVACHSTFDIRTARAAGANLVLFAPVFEKPLPHQPALPGQGLKAFTQACQAAREPAPYAELPVLALGGVTLQNASECLAAGAAGIAAIRLFLGMDGKPKQEWLQLRALRASEMEGP